MNYRKLTHYSFLTLLVTFFMSVTTLIAQDFNYDDAWGQSGFTLEKQTRSNVQVNFSIENFRLAETRINDEPMQNIEISGALIPNDEGMPNVPGSSRYIAIPEGAKASLQVIEYRLETIEDVELAPAPRIPLDTEKGPLHFEKGEVYNVDAFYPANPFQISEITEIRGVDVVMLGITPFQYNPVTKQLKVYRDVKVEVTFDGGNGQYGDTRLRSRWWDPIMEDAFLNSAALPEVDYNKRRMEVMNSTRDAGYEYLIVVPNNPEFSQWADSIKMFRQKQGILTGIVTLDEIGGNSTSVLENYFNDAYNNWDIPPAAVLLIGDYGSNAANTITSPIWDNYCASDNIWADVNNNDMPDMIFARLTAQNESQLETMVTKFINYEKNPPTNPDFYNHPITACGWQTERWFQLCSEIVGGFWREAQGKDPVRINAIYSGTPGNSWSTTSYGNTSAVVDYFGPNGLGYIPATPSELGGWTGGNATMVNNAINSGSFMLQHRDHGYEQGWGEPSYSSSNINALNNTDLTFVFSINCLTGMYNMGDECFTEKFHRHTSGGQNSGALGLIAASEVSYSFVNDAFVWGMYDNMWPEFMPTFGMPVEERGLLPAFANASGKYFLQQSAWPYNTNNKEVTYHLFHHHGGAFLNVYSEMPQELTVTHNPVLISGESSFTVNVEEGSFIALTVDGEIIGTAEGTGAPVAIEIEPQLPPNSMVVTITKQNYYRYEQAVDIIPPSGPYVVYNTVEIDDAAGGNGNGMMDFGEEIMLDMTMENVGVETAENITATITSDNEYITIVTGTANFGDIQANSTATLEDAFEIEVADNVPDMHNVAFTISVTDGTDTWESYFSIMAHAPMLEVVDLVVSDANGNGNGFLDPGENADIIFETANNGSSDAPDVLATLVTMSPFITLNNNAVAMGNLVAGESGMATFNVSVDGDTPIGTVVDLIYTAESGMYEVEEMTGLKVGLIVEDFETGDFSQYEWEFDGAADWNITSSGAYEGTYAAKSGNINDQQESVMEVTMDVMNDDEISFYYKVSSEANYDYLRFYIDGIQKAEWEGEEGWSLATFPVTEGEHTFTWSYEKDYSVSNGEDCGWIDYITFPAVSNDALIIYAGPDDQACEGNEYALNATGSNYETIMWETSGSGTFDDNTIINPVYTPSDDDYAAGEVTLTITVTGGGESLSDDMLLTFMEMPGQCPAPTGDTELCINPGVTTYETEEMANVDDYMWMIEPENAGTITYEMMTAEVNWNEDFMGEAQIMVMGMNDCGEGDMSDPLMVNIMDVPAAAAVPTGDVDLCAGTMTSVYMATEIMYATNYNWSIVPGEAGTIMANGMEAEVTWNSEWDGEAGITVTGVNECGEGETSSALMVMMTAMPETPAMPTGETELCENNTGTMYETTGANGADEYVWEVVPAEAGTIIPDGMTAEVTWTNGYSGDANIHVKAMNICGESDFSEAILVSLAPLPAQPEAISGENEACQGITVDLDVAEIANATDCEWLIEPAEAGVVTSNGLSCEVTVSETWEGDATIMVRGINDCGNGDWSQEFTLTIQDCTGIDENEAISLEVYPNPNSGTFTINLEANEAIDIRLINAIGEVVYQENDVEVNGTISKQIRTSGLANGVYYLNLTGETVNGFQKVVIRK